MPDARWLTTSLLPPPPPHPPPVQDHDLHTVSRQLRDQHLAVVSHHAAAERRPLEPLGSPVTGTSDAAQGLHRRSGRRHEAEQGDNDVVRALDHASDGDAEAAQPSGRGEAQEAHRAAPPPNGKSVLETLFSPVFQTLFGAKQVCSFLISQKVHL